MRSETAQCQPEATTTPASYLFSQEIAHVIFIAIRTCLEFYSEGK